MRFQSAFVLGGLFAIVVGVGCSNTSSTPVAPVRAGNGASAGPTPTPVIGASPTPVIVASATPAPTVAPSTAPSGTVGNINCTAPVISAPANVLEIETTGNVVGSTYTSDAVTPGDYEVDGLSVPTPSPTPTVVGTATPTPIPSVFPTFTPAPTPTPFMITIYVGEYSYPAFGGTSPFSSPSPNAAYSVAANTGCFEMILEQPVGGTAGQARLPFLNARQQPYTVRRPAGLIGGTDNAFGLGEINEGNNDFADNEIDFGNLTSVSITNLHPASGSGTFVFSTATQTGITGSITITGSETELSTFFVARRHGQFKAGPFSYPALSRQGRR